MNNLSVTNIIKSYHSFDRDFWLSYKTLEAIMPESQFQAIKLKLLKSKTINPKYLSNIDYELYLQKREEIDQEWKSKNEEAKQTGTQVHELIRNQFVTQPAQATSKYGIGGKIQNPEAFLYTDSGLFPEQRLELQLDPNYKLVGIADMIYIHDGVFDIIDWKTDEDGIRFKSHFEVSKKKSKRMKYPLSKLDDCNGIHYQLQLSLYAWMIKKLRPDLQLGELRLIHIKDFTVKKSIKVEYLEDEVESLIKWHLKSSTLKQETLKCREITYG